MIGAGVIAFGPMYLSGAVQTFRTMRSGHECAGVKVQHVLALAAHSLRNLGGIVEAHADLFTPLPQLGPFQIRADRLLVLPPASR